MVVVTCAQCGTEFEAKRRSRRYCSPTCQKRARRGTEEPGKVETEAEKVDDEPKPALAVSVLLGEDVVAATKRDLEAVGKLDSVAGRQAMVVAARMTLPKATGSEIAALSRELSRLMILAVGKAGQEADPVDEVKRKRDEKLAKARQTTA